MMEIRNKIYVWEKFRRTYKLSKEGGKNKTTPITQTKSVSPHRVALVKQLSQLIPEVPPVHTQTAKVPFRITPLPSSSKNHHRMSRETKLHSFCLGAFPGQWSTNRIAAWDLRVRKREEAGQKGWPAAGKASIPSEGILAGTCHACPWELWCWTHPASCTEQPNPRSEAPASAFYSHSLCDF